MPCLAFFLSHFSGCGPIFTAATIPSARSSSLVAPAYRTSPPSQLTQLWRGTFIACAAGASDEGGGEGGIRTPDRLAPMPHFECGAFDHSATSPGANFG